MPLFLIITKLLLLKIIITLAYEHIGYAHNPSAEEFDNLMRQTRHTWTGRLIANDRQRPWHGPFTPRRSDSFQKTVLDSRAGEYFVPKYQYGREKYVTDSTLNLKWPGSAQKVLKKPMQLDNFNNFEQQQAASSVKAVHVAPPQNIGSTFEFTMFSDEKINENFDEPQIEPTVKPFMESKPTSESVFNHNTQIQNVSSNMKPLQPIDESVFNHDLKGQSVSSNMKPLTPTGESVFYHDSIIESVTSTIEPFNAQQNQATVIQIQTDSSERAHESTNNPWQNKYSLNNIYKNNSEAHFPIFFTNPVTGIVYAITEIGRTNQNFTRYPHRKNNNNNTIPIYITKEQYDRDIFVLKKQLKNQCSIPTKSPNKQQQTNSALSGSNLTTERPQIIKLQKPVTNRPFKAPTTKVPIVKLPPKVQQNKPPPVMVQTGVTVSDQVKLPPPKRNKKLKSKKKKKKKRPGRKTVANGAPNQNNGQEPQIIMGTKMTKSTTTTTTTTKRPIITKQHFSEQLERPNIPATTTTIFSQRPIASTSGYVVPKPQIIRQNIHQTNSYINQRQKRSLNALNLTTIAPLFTTRGSDIQNLALQPITKTASDQLISMRRFNARKKGLPKLAKNATKLATQQFRNQRQNTTIRFVRKKQAKTTSKDKQALTIQRNLSVYQHNQTVTKTAVNKNSKDKRKSQKRDKADHDDGFDFFDLLDDEDEKDDSKDDDDDDENDYYYEDEKRVSTTKKPKRNIIYINQDLNEAESIEDHSFNDDESNDALKEQITHDKNSSSAEESADFGALEEFDIPMDNQHEEAPQFNDDENFSTASKNTNGKKRIRRRPASSSASDEDYNDRDDNENGDDGDGGGGGVGDFFRLIFYPVQVVMTRVFDTFAGTTGNDASNEDFDGGPTYPTYTQYSSANRIDASAENDDDDAQGNSLSSWFGYLFGFNRRTKNIGSTTAAPPTPTVQQTEAPGWFDSWFGGSKTTNSVETSIEDYDDYDKWFASWFNTKPKAKRRTETTTIPSTIPQVPILTIVDPMKNPQNWLGILAHHIINTTTTTTHNPIFQALTRATTTENPDLPRFVSYDKYQIWRLKPQDETKVKALIEYKKSDEGTKLQWLKGPSMRGLTDVLVPPKMFVDFQGALQFESIAHEILIFDVGKAIAYEQNKEQFFLTTPRPTKHQQKQKYASLINMSWNKYHAYDDIVKYLESVRMRHPQLVELFHIGRSYEGRPLIVAKLEMKHAIGGSQIGGSTPIDYKKLRHKKKSGHASAVFIEAGTHGLEWIGPATATWMINEVLRIMKSNKTTQEAEVVRNTTWYIMPVLNPDGYVYSHEYDRFWRKSRSRHISRPNGILDSAMTWLQQKKATEKVCYGVDLDRNWHYQWGRRGSSKSPCNEHFAGPSPFSEPETKALSDFLMDNRKQIKLFLSMQAYGQIISYPIKANVTFDSERLEDFMDVAMVGTDGLRKKGSKSRYKIDSSNDLVEQRAGCSDAFAAFEVGTPFSYTLYLADNGVHGYLLPSSSIEPTARDSFEIVTAMLDYI